jgi:bacillolysin/thermolysin
MQITPRPSAPVPTFTTAAVASAAPAFGAAAIASPAAAHSHGAGIAGSDEHVIDPATLSVGRAPLTASDAPRPGRQDRAVLDGAVTGIVAADGQARIAVDPASNAATFISGEFGVLVRPGVGGSGPDRMARTFLAKHGEAFGINNVHAQLELVSAERDELGFRQFRYRQIHEGLPVFGQELVVHTRGDRVTSVGGRITPNITPGSPNITADTAAERAIATQRAAGAGDQLTAQGAQKLGYYTLTTGVPRLAYEVVVGNKADQRWQLYVDAESGEVLDRWSLVHSALNRETVDSQTGKVRTEGQAPTGDAVLDKAHDNAKGVYDYFQSNFKRDSIDGRGMKLKSVVHYGSNYNNAFWNGSHMTYGDGDGVKFSPLGNASDVVAHEMMHGITERSAGLRYQRQSGALNESWSDVFGNLVEKWMERQAGAPESDPVWLIGEQVFTPGKAGDGLRSMSKPGTGYAGDPQPGHMRDYKDTSADNGGVHINSGIPNKAAYEITKAIGQDKVAAVWYRAITKYLTPTSQFTDAANVTVQSAIDLFGKGSAEAQAVAAGWASVGLTPSQAPIAGPRA